MLQMFSGSGERRGRKGEMKGMDWRKRGTYLMSSNMRVWPNVQAWLFVILILRDFPLVYFFEIVILKGAFYI